MTDKKTLLSEERSGRSLAIARADMKKSKGKKEESNTIACLPVLESAHTKQNQNTQQRLSGRRPHYATRMAYPSVSEW
jgi:hypothetical protein